MKKLLTLAIALALMLVPFAVAETETADETEMEFFTLDGFVSEVTGEYAIIETEMFGTVQANLTADTIFTSELPLVAGQYTFITYNGQMTRSLPAQITAVAIGTHRLLGEVLSIDLEQGFFMMNTELHGEIIVHCPETLPLESLSEGNIVLVYHDGAMALSLPAQIGASHVLVMDEIEGVVTEIHEDYLMIKADDYEYQVNLNAATVINGEIEPAGSVTVLMDGRVTRSLPPQIAAYEITAAAADIAEEAAAE